MANMSVLYRWFRNISIAHKLYFTVGTMALLEVAPVWKPWSEPTPLSSVARWSSWCTPAARPRSWHASSNRRRSRSGTGWRKAERNAGRGDGGLTTAEREELCRLRRENRQLRLEREILSKAAAWFARETNAIPAKGSGS